MTPLPKEREVVIDYGHTERVVQTVTSEYERRIDAMRAQIQNLEAERAKPIPVPEIPAAITETNSRKIRQ